MLRNILLISLALVTSAGITFGIMQAVDKANIDCMRDSLKAVSLADEKIAFLLKKRTWATTEAKNIDYLYRSWQIQELDDRMEDIRKIKQNVIIDYNVRAQFGPAPDPSNGQARTSCQSCHYQLVYGGRMGVSLASPFVPHN